MDEAHTVPAPARAGRRLWVRVLLMLLFAVAFHLAAWVLVAVALLQVVMRVATDSPNPRLCSLGASLGRYLLQIAEFVSFGTEELPFPFNDWPEVK